MSDYIGARLDFFNLNHLLKDIQVGLRLYFSRMRDIPVAWKTDNS